MTNAECAAAGGTGGLFATSGATGACAGSPCDMSVSADATACCTACTAVANAHSGATTTCTSASDSAVTACATGHSHDSAATPDTCTACTSQTGCQTDAAACSTDQPTKYVCSAVISAGTYYLAGTNNEIATACTLANAHSSATITCTSPTTSRTTACAAGYRHLYGANSDQCSNHGATEHTGTMQNAKVLAATASSQDDYYNNWYLVTASPTDTGVVTDYVGNTKAVTVTLANSGTTTSSTTYTLTQYTHDGPTQDGQMTAALTLGADASPVDDFYNGWTITTENPTDTGLVTDYVAGTHVITTHYSRASDHNWVSGLAGGGTTSA